jgi:hypothetical protein
MIGTTCSTIKVWLTGMDWRPDRSMPVRLQITSMRKSFLMRFRAMTVDSGGGPIPSTGVDLDGECGIPGLNDDRARETLDDLALLDDGIQDKGRFPHKHQTCRISRMYVPCHLLAQKFGFVTEQRCTE